ncbi:hypothetical protein Gasu2_43390 [Galdieria sulphuraria]|uniref:Ribosomal RNA-processing protein 7 C-terminal domain-containing protein n=1 Tax=Galdieria sulphuraria TaxID=130081 RepID=M2VWU3_GALSU|nr:uncharacterized protein Gasu_47050 [Galdieria sulphuraria]EME27716.1 hypothetical protein Gasu_47050 [Galdieria sulphuraria]GJD10129.1 hypothetical protein Gasu2_43390 [Galdieria sulphuraria]|eukprot:XP_005704236.1 hypothetical protein Gasu_47050 [Galdieria sulphuraria]
MEHLEDDEATRSLLQGFRAVAIPLKKTEDSTCEVFRWIYLKKQRRKLDESLTGLETSFLFIANLPFFVTERQLTSVLEQYGKVNRTVFGSLPESEGYSKHASVFFSDENSIELVLRAPLDFSACLADEKVEDVITGKLKEYQKWRCNPRMLAQHVDEVLFRHREKREKEEQELKYRQTVPDEDGFILVGARNTSKKSFANVKKRAPLRVAESSLKPKEGFYKIRSRKQQRKLERERQSDLH